MTLDVHFNTTMLVGLSMLPGGIVVGFLLVCLLGALGWELGSLAGAVPGVIIFLVGIVVFFVGLGQELH